MDEPSHLDLQCLPSTLDQSILKVFQNCVDAILLSAFYEIHNLHLSKIIGPKSTAYIIIEPCYEKTGFLHMRKQRLRSASR